MLLDSYYQTLTEREIGGKLAYLCPHLTSAPWVVIMRWPVPGRRSGDWHRSQATQRSSLMSTFSEPVHHDMRQKQNMLITDAIASSSTSSAFQSRCQSWNKSVGLRCLASTSLNWTQITAFFETFDFKVCKLKLDSTPSLPICLCIWVNSSKTLTSHWGGGKIPMQITCLQFRNPPDGRFM